MKSFYVYSTLEFIKSITMDFDKILYDVLESEGNKKIERQELVSNQVVFKSKT